MERNAKFILGIALFVGGFAIIGIYAYGQSRAYLRGPSITVIRPENGRSFDHSEVAVSGSAKNVSYISLNDRPIFTDTNGDFNEELLLLPGYNIITIKAEDRFGKRAEKTLEVTYIEPAEGNVATSSPASGVTNYQETITD